MRKLTCGILISLFSLSFAGDVTPTMSLRVNDLLTGFDFGAPIIGLKMALSDDVSSGFDGSTTSFRIYVDRSLGRLGLGTYIGDTDGDGDVDANDDDGSPYFTVGTSYNAMSNMNVEVDYVINNLATNQENRLQLSITIAF